MKNLGAKIIWSFVYGMSRLPFWVLHRFSDGLYFIIYYGLGYRKKVVRENLKNSFPEKTISERLKIEKKFYQGFCDIIVETVKTISISKEELQSRCITHTPGFFERIKDKNIVGISSHMGNWEWIALMIPIETRHHFYALYKPLSNDFINTAMKKSRERFGAVLVPIKTMKQLYADFKQNPYIVGLFADQAPHYYKKSFEVQFLNQQTFVVAGPGIMTVQLGASTIWGWMRRTGRSRYEYGLELLDDDLARLEAQNHQLNEADQAQAKRIAEQYEMSFEQASRALMISQIFNQKLEAQIKMAPQDWLWSHRRWKKR